jgi:uncharacterized SAM-binding protein YcdF (DUF218 family)
MACTSSTLKKATLAPLPRRGVRGCIRRAYSRTRAALACATLLLAILVGTPLTEKLYMRLDVTAPPTHADYIVCLGGNPARLLWAVDAYRRGFAPKIIVSSLPGSAQWMRDMLVQCGIPRERILVDDESSVSADHPVTIAALSGIDPERTRLLIVTDHDHSRRVAACFRKAGFEHFTITGAGFPLRLSGSFQMRCRWRLMALPRIAYEYAALVQYTLQDRI